MLRSAAKPQPRSADILVRSKVERKENQPNSGSRGAFGRCCGQECPRSGALGSPCSVEEPRPPALDRPCPSNLFQCALIYCCYSRSIFAVCQPKIQGLAKAPPWPPECESGPRPFCGALVNRKTQWWFRPTAARDRKSTRLNSSH